MKRLLTLCVVISLLIVGTVCSAHATVGDISIMADNYNTASAKLSISNGTATASGTLTGTRGVTTKATVHLYLQQYNNGEWTDYEDWLESNDGKDCTVSKTISVPKGYKYRAKASCYAYAGTKCEHVTKYSAEVSY